MRIHDTHVSHITILLDTPDPNLHLTHRLHAVEARQRRATFNRHMWVVTRNAADIPEDVGRGDVFVEPEGSDRGDQKD